MYLEMLLFLSLQMDYFTCVVLQMTFGEQNTEKEAHEMLDYAFERGINTIDTSEAVSSVAYLCIHVYLKTYFPEKISLLMLYLTCSIEE